MATATPILFSFDHEAHAYAVDGVEVPSVTQCLSSVGISDYSAVPPAALAYKREIGVAVDQFADLLDEDDADWDAVAGSTIEGYCLAYEKFRSAGRFVQQQKKLQGVAQAQGCYYGWELDREGLFDGNAAVLDLKCTAKIERSVGPQLAAYEHARFLSTGQHRQRIVVQLLPTGEFRLQRCDDAQDLQVFLQALFIETWKRNH